MFTIVSLLNIFIFLPLQTYISQLEFIYNKTGYSFDIKVLEINIWILN